MEKARPVLVISLSALEGKPTSPPLATPGDRLMEFHVSRQARDELGFDSSFFQSTGNVIIPDFHKARILARTINERVGAALLPEKAVRAGKLNAMALIDEILHDVARLYRQQMRQDAFASAAAKLERSLGSGELDLLLHRFVDSFPPLEVYRGELEPGEWLAAGSGSTSQPSNREIALEELVMLRLANENPAFKPFAFMFDDGSPENLEGRKLPAGLAGLPAWGKALLAIETHFAALPAFGPDSEDLLTMLRAPMRAAPYSLSGQLDFIRKKWGLLIGDKLLRLLGGLDLMREEAKPFFPGPGPTRALVYSGMEKEYERFSPDRDWMPNVVMIAKTTLVWLDQLSKTWGQEIKRLDQIPDGELDTLASRGINALWLIGLWERSSASARIKQKCGNPEAAASAYSLFDYEIAQEIGGWPALENLRHRAWQRGVRLAADMVPNHTGIDSAWVRDRPDLFMRATTCPYPGYSFSGENLSGDGRYGIWLEDHYYDKTDAAVVFKRVDFQSGRTEYVYHGNDGTGLPWSDTAQLDFLNPATREAVRERILHVAQNFPIIRFDAAMVIAKKHFRRLWYPEPGQGGDVPSRSAHALSHEAFESAIPNEFWREVVDQCAAEAPDTLLLAEAFWMMEGYFVRTLGMHRVYNSAFMNMLKKEENAKYRETIRNTQEFDKDILKRFVNFMNNPDEETAIAQFGDGDKYFGICTLMATMPGLPMFGHGQLEGLTEKYGMEYRRAYKDESPDQVLLGRHEREIFPLLKRRHIFSGVNDFLLFDLLGLEGGVNENAFVYSNRCGSEAALVACNNSFARAEGRVRESAPFAVKNPDGSKRLERRNLGEALGLHRERGHYLAMREQRSGLWFLRRSREVIDEGLKVILDGYQCQVFLDIFEVADDARGLMTLLHDELGGRGVIDLSEATEDLARKELYAILARFLSIEFITTAKQRLSRTARGAQTAGGENGTIMKVGAGAAFAPPEGCMEAALEFFGALRTLLREESAEEGIGPDGPQAGSAKAKKADEKAAQAALDRFLFGLDRLVALSDDGGKDARVLSEWLDREGGPESALSFLVLDSLSELVREGTRGPQDLAARARRLAERLALERKLREAERGAGVPGHQAWRGTWLAMVLSGSPLATGAQSGSPSSHSLQTLFSKLETAEEIRNVLSVNVWDGTAWFNREAFDEFLSFAALAAYARGLDSTGLSVSLVAEELALLRSFEADSGYKVSEFVKALPPAAEDEGPKRSAKIASPGKKPAPKPAKKLPVAPSAPAKMARSSQKGAAPASKVPAAKKAAGKKSGAPGSKKPAPGG
jgi:glycosidase